MSSAADLVLDNFIYRIEAIAPTAPRPRKRFRYVDPEDLDEEAIPAARTFNVSWDACGSDFEPTDEAERWADHQYTVDIYYAAGIDGYSTRTLHKIILQDLHDLKNVLRDSDNFNGTGTGSKASTSTGLHRRVLSGAKKDDTGAVWVVRLIFTCTVQETEA